MLSGVFSPKALTFASLPPPLDPSTSRTLCLLFRKCFPYNEAELFKHQEGSEAPSQEAQAQFGSLRKKKSGAVLPVLLPGSREDDLPFDEAFCHHN